jgi:hypothetical protein
MNRKGSLVFFAAESTVGLFESGSKGREVGGKFAASLTNTSAFLNLMCG